MASADYLTFEQVCEMLGKSPAEVKAYVADGRLRELRDAGQVYYRRGDVEKIAAKEGSSIVELSPADDAGPEEIKLGEGEPFASGLSSLADESSGLGVLDQSPGAGSPIDLGAEAVPAAGDVASAKDEIPMAETLETDAGSPSGLKLDEIPLDLPSSPSPLPELSSEIDLLPTGEAPATQRPEPAPAPIDVMPDLGLSGSSIISLESGVDEVTAPPKSPPKEAAVPRKGISVFDDDEVEIDTDPLGATRISSGMEELEAVGSGSGLLDLTQEKDDTSLGAELLDVISPEAGETAEDSGAVAAETVEDSGAIMAAPIEEEAPAEAVAAAPAAKAAPKKKGPVAPMTGAVPLNVCLFTGVLGLTIVGLASAATLQGVWPAFLEPIARGVIHWSVFGGLALVAVGTGLFSILVGRGR